MFSIYFPNIQPVPKERLKRARSNMKDFVELYKKTLGDSCMTSKVHCMIHILDDCEYHGCHLEALSAYPFENFQSIWSGMLRSGRLPLAQIRYDTAFVLHIIIFVTLFSKFISYINSFELQLCILINCLYSFLCTFQE